MTEIVVALIVGIGSFLLGRKGSNANLYNLYLKGRAEGYRACEDLSYKRMVNAGYTQAQIEEILA